MGRIILLAVFVFATTTAVVFHGTTDRIQNIAVFIVFQTTTSW